MTEENKTEIAVPNAAVSPELYTRIVVPKSPFIQPMTAAEVFEVATNLANSGLMGFKPNDANQISIRMMMGMEMGFSAFQAIRMIHNIKGTPAPSADAFVALVVNSPPCLYFIKIDELSDAKSCTVETMRAGASKPQRYTFTIQQAAVAGLTGKDNWKNYPDVMLYHRASAFLCRQVYPGVCAGLHTVEEMESMAFTDAERLNDATAEKKKNRDIAMAAIESKIKEAAADPVLSSFSGHIIDAFCIAKEVDYIEDASDDLVINFSKWLIKTAAPEIIGLVAKKSKSYADSLTKSVNEAPKQDPVEGPDNRDEWKEQNRHLRKILDLSKIVAPDEVVRAFKIAKKKKSFTEIPAEQIARFIEDLQSFGGDRIKGTRAIEDELNETVLENATRFRKSILEPLNNDQIDAIEQDVFASLSKKDIAAIEAKFIAQFDNIKAFEECQPDDLAMLHAVLSGGLEFVEAYLKGDS